MSDSTTASVNEISTVELRSLLAAARSLNVRVANRLQASVVRPLAALLDESEDRADAGQHDNADGVATGVVLWDLALRATALCAGPHRPTELIEAAAALQEHATRAGAAEGGGAASARLGELRALLNEQSPSIRTASKGPLLVTNVDDVHDWRVADRRDTYVGQQVTILDNRGTCQHSGLCTDRLSTVFRVKEEPFVAPSGGRMDEIIRAVRDCPSGALGYAIDGVEARADVDHHAKRAPSIEVSKDGPYRVSGGIALLDANGDDVAWNTGASREHFTLCRCGHAQNKPFCTGMHWYVEFHDPVRVPEETPTMFEWAGGLPALTRVMPLFYEKFVPADDLLGRSSRPCRPTIRSGLRSG